MITRRALLLLILTFVLTAYGYSDLIAWAAKHSEIAGLFLTTIILLGLACYVHYKECPSEENEDE